MLESRVIEHRERLRVFVAQQRQQREVAAENKGAGRNPDGEPQHRCQFRLINAPKFLDIEIAADVESVQEPGTKRVAGTDRVDHVDGDTGHSHNVAGCGRRNRTVAAERERHEQWPAPRPLRQHVVGRAVGV